VLASWELLRSLQEGAEQMVPLLYFRQTPVASHVPSLPHVLGLDAGQALPQQMPWTHKPDRQSLLEPHPCPSALQFSFGVPLQLASFPGTHVSAAAGPTEPEQTLQLLDALFAPARHF